MNTTTKLMDYTVRTQANQTFHAIDLDSYEIEDGTIPTRCGLSIKDSLATVSTELAVVGCGHCVRRLMKLAAEKVAA